MTEGKTPLSATCETTAMPTRRPTRSTDEPSLQHSTADCAGKPKNDPKNKDERRLQGFFHCRSQRSGPG